METVSEYRGCHFGSSAGNRTALNVQGNSEIVRAIDVMKEEIKKVAKNVTGIAKPKKDQVVVRKRKPQTYRFRDDGETPNNQRYPLVLYRSPIPS